MGDCSNTAKKRRQKASLILCTGHVPGRLHILCLSIAGKRQMQNRQVCIVRMETDSVPYFALNPAVPLLW